MAPDAFRAVAQLRHASVLALATGLLVAACSGSAATTPQGNSTALPSTAATMTEAPSAIPAPSKGPATQNLTLGGPAGAAAAVSNAAIRCNEPSTDGLEIAVLGQPADPNLSVYIFVQPGKLSVRYDSGSGAAYVERDFAGAGVADFNPATGATINSQLVEVPNQDAHGSLGVLTSISGSIDCGNQMPGSSTLTFSGPTPKGSLEGGLDPVNVECVTNTYGSSVSILGLARVDSTPTFMVVSVSSGSFSISASGDGFFRSGSTVGATLTATGAHVDGDAVEQLAAGSTAKPHTIHVSGDVACGTTIGG
jgi:hypothetical protein